MLATSDSARHRGIQQPLKPNSRQDIPTSEVLVCWLLLSMISPCFLRLQSRRYSSSSDQLQPCFLLNLKATSLQASYTSHSLHVRLAELSHGVQHDRHKPQHAVYQINHLSSQPPWCTSSSAKHRHFHLNTTYCHATSPVTVPSKGSVIQKKRTESNVLNNCSQQITPVTWSKLAQHQATAAAINCTKRSPAGSWSRSTL